MKTKTNLFIILLAVAIIVSFNTIQAQPISGNRGGSIMGTIIEKNEQIPVEYAYVILFNASDSSQVTGSVTNEDGHFQLTEIRPGNYYLKFQFMGYQLTKMSDIQINRNNRDINLGVITLDKIILDTESIDVVAEKPSISYKIDKKIINVDQMQTNISGTAVDILENVPSVTVDIEGNVSLRGSESFVVLIDNKPSILEPNEILQ